LSSVEMLEDIESIKRLVDLDPNLETLPPGWSISDAMASQMKQAAQYALAEGFQRLESEPLDSSCQTVQVVINEFATSTVVLCVDRQTHRQLTAPKVNVPELWRSSQAEVTIDRTLAITDEEAAECRLEAEKVIRGDCLLLLEQTLSRPKFFEALLVGATFLATSTLKLAEDREDRAKEALPLTVPIQ